MRGYFYATQEECLKHVNCSGYSTSWHYLFGLVDQSGNQLGTYMLAKWPWGIEGTYTILRKNAPRGQNCAQILMLFSNALIVDKYRDELFYAEVNKWNARPAIQAGFHIVAPSRSHNCVKNIITSVNPTRLGELAESDPDLIPPSYREVPYTSYGIVGMRNNVFTRSIVSQAQKILTI